MRLDNKIPPGWRKVTLTDVVDVNPSRELRNGTNTPFVEMADLEINRGGIQSHSFRIYRGSGTRFSDGDTIFARITPCAENGKIALVDFLGDSRVAHGSTEFIVLGQNHDHIDAKFLFYLVSGDRIHSYAISRMVGTSGRQRVPNRVFDEIVIALPPLSEQRKIATILNSVDNSIKRTRVAIEQTRRTKNSFMQDLLSNGLRGIHKKWDSHEVLGRIPATWDVWEIGKLCLSATDGPFGSNLKTAHYSASGVRVIRLQNIGIGEFLDSDKAFVPESHFESLRKYEAKPGDLIVASMGDEENPCGRSCLVPKTIVPAMIKADCFRLRLDPTKTLNEFAMWFLNSSKARRSVDKVSHGQTRIRLNLFNAKKILIPVPDVEEQRMIISLLRSVHERQKREEELLIQLENVKLALSDALLTGKVRVQP